MVWQPALLWAVFASVGIANAVMAMVFGFAAYQRGDFSLYLFFPVVVCAFQGAVWCAIAMIQRPNVDMGYSNRVVYSLCLP